MSDTFNLITALANERHMLYRLAARQHLTPDQQNRLNQIDNQLPVLWDQYRRELAGRYRPYTTSSSNDQQAA
ncbi:MAG: hypothetical protein DIU68_019150 [Chloroflexota bacterium]|nr:MAG: hypothetical protein DIU68_14050 [Chloroflexota bacterium]